MNLLPTKTQKKPTIFKVKPQKKKVALQAPTNPSVMNSIKYTSQFEEGLMHIVGKESSKMYELGDLDYEVASDEEQDNTVIGYAEALNSLDKNSRYQLLVLNKRVKSSVLNDVLLEYQGDEFDSIREEMNTILRERYRTDQQNFEIKKYAIFSHESNTLKQADSALNKMASNFKTRLERNNVQLDLKQLDGQARLKVMSDLLRPGRYFTATYEDIALSNLSSKAFIAPNRLRFPRNKNHFRVGNRYAKVLYIRQFPKYLEDQLIKEICATNHELAISIHAKPYDMLKARKTIQSKKLLNSGEMRKQQRKNFQEGVADDMISGEAAEINESTTQLLSEFKDNAQKYFSGVFAIYLNAESKEELAKVTKDVRDAVSTWQVELEEVEQYKEEALNTILPIGKPYLDVEMNYMRDMTTLNVVTQMPFTNKELQSKTGIVYGQNQRTHNMITVDRRKDLIAPTGLVLGSTGGGKGMITKWEIIYNFLRYTKRRLIIVDPESEYLPVGKRFGAEILDISTGTENRLNILDMADVRLLDEEDRKVDLVKEKANLLSSLFESLLKEYSDAEASLVDRVTRLTYEKFGYSKLKPMDITPTLVDWYHVLLAQPEQMAQEFAVKVEPYTIGSQDIFAHPTNVDLNKRFVVFNTKSLDDRMKPFAMKVILDQIWKQVVEGQGKYETDLYFDELQLNFDTEANANWFMALWSRVRKYGAAPTGITQNIITLLNSVAGQRMISNSEFFILLRQKIRDLNQLSEVVRLTPTLMRYVYDTVPQGTGLISAGGTVVPFENPIPKNTELYEIMNTDADIAV